MQLRYNYRLYPSPGQQQALARAFGCARVVFNDALAVRRDAHQARRPYPTDAELSARLATDKATPQRAWLGDGCKIASPRFLRRAERKLRKAQVHATVADARRDWLHKEPTGIIRDNQAVYGEDLCVAALKRTRLGKSVSDAGWSACSACGVKDGPKPLSVREWACASCGTVHDRDVNAARNVLALGRRESLNACGGTVRPVLVLAGSGEAGSRRGAA